MDSVAALAYWAVFAAAWFALVRTAEVEGRPPVHVTAWGVGLWVAVAGPTLVQLLVAPSLLDAGQRDSAAIGDGEWWRLGTAVVLQDGGWVGALFNLACLAVSVVLAVDVLGGPAMVGLFAGGGVVCNLLTVATFGQTGAGNSMATMVMVVAAAVIGLSRWPNPRQALPLLGLLVAAGAALLVVQDQHGLAVAVGLASGGVGAARARP